MKSFVALTYILIPKNENENENFNFFKGTLDNDGHTRLHCGGL